MATRWAVVNGNWSNTATWDGGTLPAVDDDVFADGKTVAIDQNVTVLSIRTTQRSGGLAGGGFTISGNFNITATGVGILPGTTPCLTYNGDVVVALNANVASSSTGGAHGAIFTGAEAELTLTGNANGLSGNIYPIYLTGNSAKLTVFGDLTGGGAGTTANAAFLDGSSPIVTVTGNLTGGPGGSALRTTGISAQATITGNLLGAVSSNGQAVTMNGASARVFVTGAVEGRANHGMFLSGITAEATVTGDIYGGYATGIAGVIMNGTGGILTATGNFYAGVSGNANNAINCSSTQSGTGVVLSGNLIDAPNGAAAVYARLVRIMFNAKSGYTQYVDNSNLAGEPVIRISSDLVPGVPSEENVREGSVYGFDDELTGTLAVPDANSVAAGIAVDDTVGTAAVKLSDIAAVVGAQIAAAITNAGGE